MKIFYICLCAYIELFFVHIATAAYITNCITIPENPTENTPFILRAQGSFVSSAWEIFEQWYIYPEYCPSYQISGNDISANLYYWKASDIEFPAFFPWQHDMYINGLTRGEYIAYVTIQSLDGTARPWTRWTSFVVKPRPSFNSQSISSTNLILGWNGDTSLIFSIQYSTQLAVNVWRTTPSFSNISGTSGSMEYQEPLSNGPPRMFRILSTAK